MSFIEFLGCLKRERDIAIKPTLNEGKKWHSGLIYPGFI